MKNIYNLICMIIKLGILKWECGCQGFVFDIIDICPKQKYNVTIHTGGMLYVKTNQM